MYSGVPGFYMNDRLRTFEQLRPTRTDKGLIADALARAPDRGSNTEAFFTSHLLENGPKANLCTREIGGKGFERTPGRLRIMPSFDVTELFFSRPAIHHGNIKHDGIGEVWRRILETELPRMPDPDELARLHEDFESEKLHPGADSVYMRICDRYWNASARAPSP